MRERYHFQERDATDKGYSAGDFPWTDVEWEDLPLLAVGAIMLFALSLSAVGFLFL